MLLKFVVFSTIKKRRVVKIIVAKTKTGKLIHLTSIITPSQLSVLKQQERFFCPGCGADMILKTGEVKIPHFAHRSLAECDPFSEAESPLHLKGKMLLHQFFTENHHQAELEKYFPPIKQRADVFVENQMAVEFQCSAISLADVKSRSAGYASIAVKVIWIYGMDYLPLEGIKMLKLKPFESALLQESAGADFLLGFNPATNRFYYHSSLFFIGGRRWIGKTKSLSAEKQVFPFAVPKKLSVLEFKQLMVTAMEERERYIQSQQRAKNRYQNLYWVLCYELGIVRSELPQYIGVPIKGSEIFKEQPTIWQLQVLEAKSKGVELDDCIQSGKIRLWNVHSKEAACQLAEDYVSFAETVMKSTHTLQEITDLLYAIYCKNLGKLRK